jgi:hypothetical protein
MTIHDTKRRKVSAGQSRPRIGQAAFIAALCAAVVLPVVSVPAANRVWTGLGGDGKWNTPANWQNNAKPVDGDMVILTDSSENDIAGLSLAQIVFTTTANQVLSGHALTLTGA